MLWGAPETARSAPDGAPRAKHAAAETAAAQPVTGDQVLVSFRGGRITVADLQAAIANKDEGTRARLAHLPARRHFLDEMVRYDLLALEAERRGYAQHPAVIEAAKRAAIDHMTEKELAVDPMSIPKAEVQAFFEAHRAEYERPEMRRASHIALASEAEARALIAELKGVTRERFAKVAGERSQDPRTRKQGGELGYFTREGRATAKGASPPVPPELAAAAFSLKRDGEIAPRPIAHGGLFSVLMRTGSSAAQAAKYAELEPLLRERIAGERSAQATQALVTALEAQWKPETHPELLGAIVLERAPRPDRPHGFPAAPPDPRAPTEIVEPDGI